MLTYLQGNTHPEISIATYRLAQFCQDSRLSHEQATTLLGRYLAHNKDRGIVYEPVKSMGIECYVDTDLAGGWNITTSACADNIMSRTGFVITYANFPIYWASCLQTETKDRGIVYEPDNSMGIECYVDADFAGGWIITTSAYADYIMSCTGFIITYANCPIYWASCLQTEIALSTAKAEYIAMSSALHEVIPLMTLMKELHTIFPLHINKPNFFYKVHEDNQSTI
jgi:hypothetical protein